MVFNGKVFLRQQGGTMKALVISASPNLDEGNTSLILNPFLEGLLENGVSVETFYATRLKVKPCCGKFNCWFETPGVCSQRDDMDRILPLIASCDILVLATPLYVDGMTGPMKMILDRVLPIAHPFIDIRDGHCRHAIRQPVPRGKLVLVSNCGFWEEDNFVPLIAHAEAVSKNLGREFSGALIRPHGPAMKDLLEQNIPIFSARAREVAVAAKRAGYELATAEFISVKTLAEVKKTLLPRWLYVHSVSKSFKKLLKAAQSG
jgi:multimeric flavodoxin WrbA